MFVRIRPKSQDVDFESVTPTEAWAMLCALRHEMLRCDRRISDPNLQGASAESEKKTKSVLVDMAERLNLFARRPDA